MVRFYGIECDARGTPDDDDPRFAVVYKFASAKDARRWAAELGRGYQFWLDGSTLLANTGLSDATWRRVVAVLSKGHDGQWVDRRR